MGISAETKIDALYRHYKISPSYNIEHKKQSDNGGIELSMDLPGVRKEDINVQLEENSRFLRISGKRISNSNNGVLRVAAPGKEVSKYESIRKLPIIEKNEEG